MAFAQLTYLESLCDIEFCLRWRCANLYQMGFRGCLTRNTLAHGNQKRYWRVFADFARVLLAHASSLYRDGPFALESNHLTYEWDYASIDLCLSMSPLTQSHGPKCALTARILLDLRDLYICERRRNPRRSHSRSIAARSGCVLAP